MAKISRKKAIRWFLGIGCSTVLVLIGGVWFLADQFAKDWGSTTKIVQTTDSPDGAYVASVTDTSWGIGGISRLEIKPKKPSRLAVRFPRLFAHSYSDDFEQIISIKWVSRRTLQVKYSAIPGGNGNHATSWGDIHLDNRPISVQ